MTSRYTLTLDAQQLIKAYSDFHFPEDLHPFLAPRYNIPPSANILAVPNDGTMAVSFFRWGLIPHWAKPGDTKKFTASHNARSEDAAKTPSFKKPLRVQRCVILADSFFVWAQFADQGRTLSFIFRVRLESGEAFAFAGLWDEWQSTEGTTVRSASILTTDGNEMLKALNPQYRMPVILPRSAYKEWLAPEGRSPEQLSHLLAPYSVEDMSMYAVTDLVNDPKNDNPAVLEPLPKEENPFV